MWPFKKKPRQRRLDGLKVPPGASTAWRRFARGGGIFATVIALLLYVAAAAMDLWPVQPQRYRLGQYMPEDVHARVRFRMVVGELVEKASRRAERGTPAVFDYDQAAVEDIVAALRKMPERAPAQGPSGPPATQPTTAPARTPTTLPAADANMPSPWRQLAQDPNALKTYVQNVDKLAQAMPGVYVVRLKDAEQHKPLLRWPEKAMLQTPSGPLEMTLGELVDVTDADEVAATAGRLASIFLEPRRKPVEAYLRKALAANPIYRYDRRQTQDRMDAAVGAVNAQPPDDAYKEYLAGQRIVSRSKRKASGPDQAVGLSAQELAVLQAEHRAFVKDEIMQPVQYWSRIAGRAVILLLIVAMLAAYVGRYHGDLLADSQTMMGFLALLVGMLGANRVLVGALRMNPYVALLPAMMAGAILALARGQRFALAVGAAVAMLIVLQMRGRLELLLVLLAGMAAIIFQLGEIRTRTKLIRTSGVAAGISLLVVFATGLATAKPLAFAMEDATWAAGCGLMTGFIVQGTLPLIERAFHVATSLTLLEWCDASRPLLKRLAMEAPGTYNHSLQLGSLCETAADAIGARGLLARVGAYYHDIGKINKPDYFIENQAGSPSKHAKLSPAMSLLIIIGHVKDGLELAREYGLPKVLHEFIASHHGTTLVQCFYHAATEQRKDADDRAPDETEFRYPGPKPTSKEPAILLLADAAESSIRAMTEPTPGRIEHQIHVMVNRRLMGGQLDECGLTLKEVHQIELSLVKSLSSMHHTRITYPAPANTKPAPSEHAAKNAGGEAANGEKNPRSDSARQ